MWISSSSNTTKFPMMNKYDTVAQAIKHGFCAMTTIEVMTKMYEKYGERH